MSSFKVGDRVAIYAGQDRLIGTVESIEREGTLFIRDAADKNKKLCYPAHPKQCRRLKPKKRRGWWIAIPENPMETPYLSTSRFEEKSDMGGKYIRDFGRIDIWVKVREILLVREVRK